MVIKPIKKKEIKTAQGFQNLPASPLEAAIAKIQESQKQSIATSQPQAPNATEVFRNEQGIPSGITVGGKTYLGLSPNDVNKMAQADALNKENPFNAQPVGTAANIAQQQAQGAQLAPQVGQTDQSLLSRIEAQPLDAGEAIGAGLAGVIPGLLGGAVAGAGIGGAATIPAGGAGAIPGAVIGALTGAVGGFLVGVRGSMKDQMSGSISSAGLTPKKVTTNLRALVTDTNKNPQNAAENLEMFNYQLSLMDMQEGKLIKETSRDLNKWLGQQGETQLQQYALFNSQGGTRQFLEQQMQMALLNPNPNTNLITMDDLNDYENE